MKLLQEQEEEMNVDQRREDELISVQQTKEKDFNNAQLRQEKIKEAFDRHTKANELKPGDSVLI